MTGRDPHESGTCLHPLELVDLTFVVAFGTAANESPMPSPPTVGSGIAAFAFATFGISWAWISFTWFASAYDTDDWVWITTMVRDGRRADLRARHQADVQVRDRARPDARQRRHRLGLRRHASP